VSSDRCVQAKAEASKLAGIGGKNRRRSKISSKTQKQRPIVEYTRGVEEEQGRAVLPGPPRKIHR